MSKQDDWFFRVVYDFIGEIWLVVENQCDIVFAGDIFRRDDREFVPGNGVRTACGSRPLTFDSGPSAFESNTLDTSTRNRAAHRDAMQHAVKLQIVNVE